MLRQLTIADAAEVFFLRSDETVMKYIERPRAESIDDAIHFINMVNLSAEENNGINWGITLKGEKQLIGYLGYYRMRPEHHRAEVGYALHPHRQGKGIASEALAAVLEYGFRVMKLHSVEANVNPENTASIKLLERNGFVREAYFKEDFLWEGKFLDSAIYSLLTPC